MDRNKQESFTSLESIPSSKFACFKSFFLENIFGFFSILCKKLGMASASKPNYIALEKRMKGEDGEICQRQELPDLLEQAMNKVRL